MIPADAWPQGDRLSWSDDETLTHYDFTTDPYTLTPYDDEEVAEAEARAAQAAHQAGLLALRTQLGEGVAGIREARQAAIDDRERALQLRATAVTAAASTLAQRQTVAAFTPAATYNAAQLGQVRNAIADALQRIEEVQRALADFYTYRAAVNTNAVTTDNALLWLARLASGVIDD